jgi:DNA-binding beta-propeller fold protein YncE
MHRSLSAAAILLSSCALLAAAFDLGQAPTPPKTAATPRMLPGVQPGGSVLLPNQWSLRPAGRQRPLGDFPVNLALHPGGRWLAVLHAGYGDHEIMIVDLETEKVASRVLLEQTFYGLCFSPDGAELYASGAEFHVIHAFRFDNGLLANHRELPIAEKADRFVVCGIAADPTGKTLYAAAPWGDAVVVRPVRDGEAFKHIPLEKDSYPYTCLVSNDGQRLFVSLWAKSAVAVVNLQDPKSRSVVWATEPHPTEMALSPDGRTLFVACANSTKVSVLATDTGKGRETISCSLYPLAVAGNTPNSLSLTPDGQLLFVANADANNLAVFNVGKPGEAKPLGLIPVGWYPTSVRFNPVNQRLYVANGKGLTSRANPQGPQPGRRRFPGVEQYIASLFQGTLSILNLPTPRDMETYRKQAYRCSPLRADLGVTAERGADNPIPGKVGDPSPIKHCIYIIKENRTYDQVLGDVKEGNGEPSLCIFPEKVTPNQHKLALEFALLDNFYVESEVSADGHEWSMGAYATDFVEKVWPLNYRRSPLGEQKKRFTYPSEGVMDVIARPSGGYLWDRCAEAGVSYRSYGEWIENGKTPKDPGRARVKALEGHFDPGFRGYDLDYPDQKRADRFIEELARFEKEGDMPQLIIMRLPNDHTYGTRVGKPTPTAMVADNDLALGRVVEAVSKSKFWKDTALFVVEDDAQNGPDHVDAHRTIAFVVSPYTKRGQVDSTLYSTTSMLRTMELILGLKPLTQFDAAARPMYASFQAKPDLRPYQHVVPGVDLTETNQKGAWGAKESEEFDLTKEDAADDLRFNEVIWRSVRGADSPMPPPVRAAFVFPHGEEEKGKD